MKHFIIALLTLAFGLSSGSAFALTQTEVSQLYIGVFGRASEGGGNSYWQSDPQSTSMTATANVMLNTDPAKAYFGPTLNNNQDFIEHIYRNTLDKTYAEDTAGVDYWVSELDGGKNKGEIIAALIVAAQHLNNAGAAQDLFNNKVEVSNYCADNIFEYTELATFTGFIDGVTNDDTTVRSAKALINAKSPSTFAGNWEGEMYPGVSIAFEVEEKDGAFYVKKAAGTFYVSDCNNHVSWESGDTFVIISNNQCSMSFPDIQMELNITFDSKTESHGTWKSNETLCPGISIDGTFRAMRFVDDTAKQTIPVGRLPKSITISSDGAYVYVSNVGDNTLTVIQTSDNTVIDTISVGEKPGDIAVTPNGNFVYVTSPISDSISVIRTVDNTVIGEISVVDPKALAVSLNGEYLYVTSCGDYVTRHEYSKSTVTVIQTVDNSIVDEISVGDSPSQIALSPDGKYIYVTNSGSDATGAQQPSISVIRTSDNSIVDTITSLLLDSNDLFKDIVVSPNGEYVYVLDGMPHVIRASDNKYLGWVTLQGPVQGIDVSPNGEFLYLLIGSSWAEPNITALQTSTHNDAFKITLISFPLDIAVSPNGEYLYVTGGDLVTLVKL